MDDDEIIVEDFDYKQAEDDIAKYFGGNNEELNDELVTSLLKNDLGPPLKYRDLNEAAITFRNQMNSNVRLLDNKNRWIRAKFNSALKNEGLNCTIGDTHKLRYIGKKYKNRLDNMSELIVRYGEEYDPFWDLGCTSTEAYEIFLQSPWFLRKENEESPTIALSQEKIKTSKKTTALLSSDGEGRITSEKTKTPTKKMTSVLSSDDDLIIRKEQEVDSQLIGESTEYFGEGYGEYGEFDGDLYEIILREIQEVKKGNEMIANILTKELDRVGKSPRIREETEDNFIDSDDDEDDKESTSSWIYLDEIAEGADVGEMCYRNDKYRVDRRENLKKFLRVVRELKYFSEEYFEEFAEEMIEEDMLEEEEEEMLDEETIERIKIEREKAEQERLEREKAEQERLEQEKIEREKAMKKKAKKKAIDDDVDDEIVEEEMVEEEASEHVPYDLVYIPDDQEDYELFKKKVKIILGDEVDDTIDVSNLIETEEQEIFKEKSLSSLDYLTSKRQLYFTDEEDELFELSGDKEDIIRLTEDGLDLPEIVEEDMPRTPEQIEETIFHIDIPSSISTLSADNYREDKDLQELYLKKPFARRFPETATPPLPPPVEDLYDEQFVTQVLRKQTLDQMEYDSVRVEEVFGAGLPLEPKRISNILYKPGKKEVVVKKDD